MSHRLNIAQRLTETAARSPQQRAVLAPSGRNRSGRLKFRELTFEQLDHESDRLARGLVQMGVTPGTRLVLMVRPGLEFVALTFALFKVGAVIVLIDPGMGRTNIFRCLTEVDPAGFVAIPIVQAIRRLKQRQFPNARFNVTVGRRWFWDGSTYNELLGKEWTPFPIAETNANDLAAIIFTSGSTGPPKGVSYEHGMFNAQVDLIRDHYQIDPGEIDLSGFPLFALFNAAMGVTTIIPDMDPTRPAKVRPENIVDVIHELNVTQAYGSPAMWNRVGRYCEERAIKLPSLRRVLSAGAPVPLHVIERMTKAFSDRNTDIYTPYGATESLPVCSISGHEVLTETAAKTRTGAGTCVGKPFAQISVKVVEITEGPIESLSDARELPSGQVGEIIVRGPSVTREYFRRPDETRLAKIADGEHFWHRIGDVGYFDESGALWFCGRKSHVVETSEGRMFPVCCEAIFNEHPRVYRTALVGVGTKPEQEPVIVVEPEQGHFPNSRADRQRLTNELLELGKANAKTASIRQILFHQSLPVDTRHNVKIARLVLASWAETQLGKRPSRSTSSQTTTVSEPMQEIVRQR